MASPQPENSDGLISAFILDGNGGGKSIGWKEIGNWNPEQGPIWIHLDRTGEKAKSWLFRDSGIDAVSAETLLRVEGNRPRVQNVDQALLIALRGINRTEGEAEDDMPTMHIWVEENRVITLRRRKLMAGTLLADEVRSGTGPATTGDLIVRLTHLLMDPVIPIISELDDNIDSMQQEVLSDHGPALRYRLQSARQDAINFRRHIAPQRDALSRLYIEPVDWFSDLNRSRLREITDHTSRYVEDLDAARERAAVAQEELTNQLAERMNKTMYLLTIISALLLPASLLTGLFGINVGGMPGVDSDTAFYLVVIGIPVMAVIEYWLLKKLKWI